MSDDRDALLFTSLRGGPLPNTDGAQLSFEAPLELLGEPQQNPFFKTARTS